MNSPPVALFPHETSRDVGWNPAGYVTLSGDVQRLAETLDRMFVGLGAEFAPQPLSFPPVIPAATLNRVGYFQSFPHLANFLTSLPRGADELRAFAADPISGAGDVNLPSHLACREVLTPAACYHIYSHLQGTALGDTRHFTTRCTCFRCEESYSPLTRQRSFSMRELVAVGRAEEVKRFLEQLTDQVTELSESWGLGLSFEVATDPFFDPANSPQKKFQQLLPNKHEMIYGGSLAIGSVNFHRNFFGESFAITLDGSAVFSGCVAFGVDRWVYAFLDRFGPRADDWPVSLDEGQRP